MIVDKVELKKVLISMEAILNNKGECLPLTASSIGVMVDSKDIVKLEPISEDTGIYGLTKIDNETIEPILDYKVLATMFPLDEKPKLYKHSISEIKANFVNGSIPIYLNTGSEIYVEAETIDKISNISLGMIQGCYNYLEWGSIISSSNRNQSETLQIIDNMPAHLFNSWYKVFYKQGNPPC